MASLGATYGWGYGQDARLGLEVTEDQLTPLQYPKKRALVR